LYVKQPTDGRTSFERDKEMYLFLSIGEVFHPKKHSLGHSVYIPQTGLSNIALACKLLRFHSGAVEVSILFRHGAVSLGKWC